MKLLADLSLAPWMTAALGALGALVLGFAVHALLFGIARRLMRESESPVDDVLVRRVQRPMRLLFPLLALQLVLPSLGLTPDAEGPLRHAMGLTLIGTVAWLAVALTAVGERVVSLRWKIDVRDNLEARQIHTQFAVLRRVLVATIVVVACGAMLMTFPRIRQLGTSLLASAGIAGLILGMAARPALSNLIAGIQLALTQPIRIDDVVIVEGEWGRVEEIGTTFVVVRIWDDRRLVVPLSQFIEKAFQNWTRTTADLLGTVFLHVDYTAPLEEIRAELKRVVEGSELWDGRVCGLQVTEAGERTLQLRALVSASDSSKCWDLRCLVREHLVGFLQAQHPACLPRARAELVS